MKREAFECSLCGAELEKKRFLWIFFLDIRIIRLRVVSLRGKYKKKWRKRERPYVVVRSYFLFMFTNDLQRLF